MSEIFLSHNPFLIKTEIFIDSEVLRSDSDLAERTGNRLQMWVEDFFDLLHSYLNAPSRIDLSFQGLKTDFSDIELAAREAERSLGCSVDLKYIPVDSASIRLDRLRELHAEALNGPLTLLKGEDFTSEFERALDPAFDVNVIATMSSGKSTLINSMLGFELLPTRNEACTATIARIRDKDNMVGFRGVRMDEDGKELNSSQEVSQKILEDWNSDSETFLIDIVGDIPYIKEQDHASLVLVDTPGPNNSRNDAHEIKTRRLISNRQRPIILYVMNATQLSTNDDRHLLISVRDAMDIGGKQAKDRFFFVVNKIDEFDPQKKNESVGGALNNVRNYLAENGIKDPSIFPVSAILAKLIRLKKRDPDSLTRRDKGELQMLTGLFVEEESMHLLQHMSISPNIRRTIEQKIAKAEESNDLEELASIHSGIPVVEATIEEYLIKYAYPARITSAREVLNKFLDRAADESEVYTRLEKDKGDLQEINEILAEITKKQNDAGRSQKFKDELRARPFKMSKEVEQQRRSIEKKFELQKRSIGQLLRSTHVSIPDGSRTIEDAKNQARQSWQEIIALLEDALEVAQKQEVESLKLAYQEYIIDLFGGKTKDLAERIPALKKLKSVALSLPVTSSLTKKASYEKRVATGTYIVNIGKWYNPFSWGDEETRTQYENKDFMDLNKVWKHIQENISENYYTLLKSFEQQITQQTMSACEEFINLMSERLDGEFNELIKNKTEALQDKKKLATKVDESKKCLTWIKQYRLGLDSALAFSNIQGE